MGDRSISRIARGNIPPILWGNTPRIVKGIVIVTDSATSGDGQGSGGQQLPPGARGYDGFGGHVGRTSAESTPWWAPETKAPAGAPNIVVILIDDMGYSDIGPFGSEIDTPNLNRLADSGYRLSNYHTTSVCSPARAALLTGLNPHRAGYGSVANFDPGFPGLRMELADDASASRRFCARTGMPRTRSASGISHATPTSRRAAPATPGPCSVDSTATTARSKG